MVPVRRSDCSQRRAATAQVVGGELALEAVDRDLTRRDSHDAGVIDEQIERLAGKALDGASGERTDGALVGQVDQRRAVPGEFERGMEADATVGTGDDDAASLLRGDVVGGPWSLHRKLYSRFRICTIY